MNDSTWERSSEAWKEGEMEGGIEDGSDAKQGRAQSK